jgi:hypothetical protein
MNFINIKLKIDKNEFPIFTKLKHNEISEYCMKIFKTGYNIHFPSSDILLTNNDINKLSEKLDILKTDMKNSNISNKLEELDTSLNKLIGISSNSSKKGLFAENMLENIINSRYGDIIFERKSATPHSADAWLYFPNNKKVMLESKNYTSVVNKDELKKFEQDMIKHNIKWGLFVSFNSGVVGMRDMDLHHFYHNNHSYYMIIISNLIDNITKLDLGIQIIRKLNDKFDNTINFPWIINDISNNLNELNNIIQRNYVMRDAFYNMEKNINKLLCEYHMNLRDYQCELENKIKEIIHHINSTMDKSIHDFSNNYKILLEKYKDYKIEQLLVRFIDICINKSWEIEIDEDNDNIKIFNKHKNKFIGTLKILNNKIKINILSIIMILEYNNDIHNKLTLELLNTLSFI